MQIIPAIDIKDKMVVRLEKGDIKSAKIYSHSPVDLAKKFEDLGAQWLHIVDLDGAFSGNALNFKTIEKIASVTNLKIQLGGGLRSKETIKSYMECGITRAILGSVALQDPSFVKEIAKEFRIAVGIDAIDGFVATWGWTEISKIRAEDLAKLYANAGVETIIATDISKDGMLCGVNGEFASRIAKESGLDTIASGGVSDLEDIRKLSLMGNLAGVIIGKAYYEGRIDLKEAFENKF